MLLEFCLIVFDSTMRKYMYRVRYSSLVPGTDDLYDKSFLHTFCTVSTGLHGGLHGKSILVHYRVFATPVAKTTVPIPKVTVSIPNSCSYRTNVVFVLWIWHPYVCNRKLHGELHFRLKIATPRTGFSHTVTTLGCNSFVSEHGTSTVRNKLSHQFF